MHEHSVSKSTSLKKNALNKLFIIVLSTMIAFTAFIQSTQKAEANPIPLLMPAGITVGAGTYAVGGLMLAGLVGAVGYDEYSEQINEHAQGVWNGGLETAGKSLNWSLEQAKNAGNGIVTLQSEFINFMEGQLTNIGTATYNITHVNNSGVLGFSKQIMTNSGTRFTISANDPGEVLYVNGRPASAVLIDARYDGIYKQVSFLDGKGNINEWTFPGEAKQKLVSDALALLDTEQKVINAASYFYGLGVAVGNADYPLDLNALNTGISKTREAWESMRDAGLVLPVDSSIPINTATGEPLTYNPDADNYTGIDGGVYEGVPGWIFPQPKIRTGNPDIPSGVYVDTPVITGNPAYDTPILENPAIPKTTTNIYTGTTTANPDVPITPTPTPTPKPEPTAPKLPRVPGSQAPVPALIFMAFFDLLRALLMYLVRMFNWIMTIPFVDEKPIDNPYFQWFRQAKILGVYPYTLVCSMATFFLGFKLVKAVRSFLP